MNLRSLMNVDDIDATLSLDRCVSDPLVCYGGGGKGGSSQPQVIETPPPPAPPAEDATMEEFTDEEEAKQQRTAITQGAKSLQIPLATGGNKTVGTA